jgi:HD superfamily phosphohydrolase
MQLQAGVMYRPDSGHDTRKKSAMFEQLPEVFGPFEGTIRIPEFTSIPVTGRLLRLIDSKEFQRLRMIRQLGFVDSVFPGAYHTRFEHSLGVYSRAIQLIKHLWESTDLNLYAKPKQITTFLIGCLLHDLGHYHGAHVIEELGKVKGLATNLRHFNHTETGFKLLTNRNSEVGAILSSDFGIEKKEIAEYIYRRETGGGISEELYKLLDGPIDIDKMDYLERDSIHTGVPYGRNYDAARLVENFTLVEKNGKAQILLKDKGKASAEIFIFSRYVMFTQVYWHHTARAFSAMFRRAFIDLVQMGIEIEDIIGEKIFTKTNYSYFNDQESFRFVMALARKGERKTKVARQLLDDISTGREGLYRRLLVVKGSTDPFGNQYESTVISNRIVKKYIAGLENWREFCREVSSRVAKAHGLNNFQEHHLLIDTPLLGDKGTIYPLYYPGNGIIKDIRDISPVARALDASFNEEAKQVRLYIHPGFSSEINPKQAYQSLYECLS